MTETNREGEGRGGGEGKVERGDRNASSRLVFPEPILLTLFLNTPIIMLPAED